MSESSPPPDSAAHHADPSAEITRLLKRWGDGDSAAADELLPLLYQRLRAIAGRVLRTPAGGLNLQPTELVAEAWLKLDHEGLDVESRQHFLALSARVMRQVLVDQVRREGADKRGGGWLRITLTNAGNKPAVDPVELLHLDQGLTRLAEVHPRAAKAIELSYFGGMTGAELAAEFGLSDRTVDRDLRFGRAWLKDHLSAR